MNAGDLHEAGRSLVWAIGGLAVAFCAGLVLEAFRNPLGLLAAAFTGGVLGRFSSERWHSWRFVVAVASILVVVGSGGRLGMDAATVCLKPLISS